MKSYVELKVINWTVLCLAILIIFLVGWVFWSYINSDFFTVYYFVIFYVLILLGGILIDIEDFYITKKIEVKQRS